jgi:hypothetical protein
MLVGRHPVGQFVSDRFEVTNTAQLFGTEALGHPARHLRDVTKLCSFDEDALDAQGFEFPGRFRTSRGVRRVLSHRKAIGPESVVRGATQGLKRLCSTRRVPQQSVPGRGSSARSPDTRQWFAGRPSAVADDRRARPPDRRPVARARRLPAPRLTTLERVDQGVRGPSGCREMPPTT